MVVYQKFGVIGLTLSFAILQKFKFQIFRLFIVYDDCRHPNACANSTILANSSDAYFENEKILSFLFKCMLVNNGVSILPCIFFAAWSDKHGRKLLLALPYIGSIIGDGLILLLLFIPSTPRDILLLSEAIHGFCGGTILVVLGCMCYITDSTDHRLRTWFIALFLGLLNVLPVVEMTLQYYWTPLETKLDFRTLVMIAVSIRLALSVYFLIYIKMCVIESVFVLGTFHGNPLINLLTPINVSDTVSCVFKRRMDNMRLFIITLSTVFIFYSILLYGNLLIFPLHFRNVLRWSYRDIIIFSVVFTAGQTMTLWLSTYTSLKWRVLDINLGVYGGVSLALSCLTLTFLRNSLMAIIGVMLGVASLLIPTSIISVLSKLIERVETGTMYAGIGFLMLVTQLVAIPSYEALDKLCAHAGIPQVIFLPSFGLATFGLLLFLYLRKNIAPELLGHLNASESLALLNSRREMEYTAI